MCIFLLKCMTIRIILGSCRGAALTMSTKKTPFLDLWFFLLKYLSLNYFEGASGYQPIGLSLKKSKKKIRICDQIDLPGLSAIIRYFDSRLNVTALGGKVIHRKNFTLSRRQNVVDIGFKKLLTFTLAIINFSILKCFHCFIDFYHLN